MKIVVICRTLNEEKNIGLFCENYSFADRIVVTDGGSEDDTRAIIRQFDNAEIMDVSHLSEIVGGFPMTPPGPQINIGIDRAKKLRADWIVLDEADCWPNPVLKKRARGILETTDKPSVFVYRLYIYGYDKYFSKMMKPGQSLWAWRPDIVDVYSDSQGFTGAGLKVNISENYRLRLEPPEVCLHYFYPNPETINKKMACYAARGTPVSHPDTWIYAPADPLPDWATKEPEHGK